MALEEFKKKSLLGLNVFQKQLKDLIEEHECYFCDTCGSMVQVRSLVRLFIAGKLDKIVTCCKKPYYWRFNASNWKENGRDPK